MSFGINSQQKFSQMKKKSVGLDRTRRTLAHGPVIRRIIEVLGVTTDGDLIAYLGLSSSTLSRLKETQGAPEDLYLRLVAAEQGVMLHWLKTGRGPKWQPTRRVTALPAWLQEVVQMGEGFPAETQETLRLCARLLAASGPDTQVWQERFVEIARAFAGFVAPGRDEPPSGR